MHLPPLLFGTLREHYILLFGMASGFALTFGFIGAWVGARLGSRATSRGTIPTDSPELEAIRHLPEIAAAVDTLAIEVERLGEAQRFIAKTLIESAPRRPIGQPPAHPRRDIGQITPH
jgi:hypothetical protein